MEIKKESAAKQLLNVYENYDLRFPTLDEDIKKIVETGYCCIDGCLTTMSLRETMLYVVSTSKNSSDAIRRFAQLHLIDEDKVLEEHKEYIIFGCNCFIRGIYALQEYQKN